MPRPVGCRRSGIRLGRLYDRGHSRQILPAIDSGKSRTPAGAPAQPSLPPRAGRIGQAPQPGWSSRAARPCRRDSRWGCTRPQFVPLSARPSLKIDRARSDDERGRGKLRNERQRLLAGDQAVPPNRAMNQGRPAAGSDASPRFPGLKRRLARSTMLRSYVWRSKSG